MEVVISLGIVWRLPKMGYFVLQSIYERNWYDILRSFGSEFLLLLHLRYAQ